MPEIAYEEMSYEFFCEMQDACERAGILYDESSFRDFDSAYCGGAMLSRVLE